MNSSRRVSFCCSEHFDFVRGRVSVTLCQSVTYLAVVSLFTRAHSHTALIISNYGGREAPGQLGITNIARTFLVAFKAKAC